MSTFVHEEEKTIKQILDIIYPQVCSICGKPNKESLCNKCKIKLEKEFNFQIDDYSKTEKEFMEHGYFFKYENLIRNQILSYKFQEKAYIYKTIAKFLEKKQKSFEILRKYDIILVVPISFQRKMNRGYNQSELLAKEIANILQIKTDTKTLKKTKNIIAQSTLNKEQRERNVIGAYKVNNIEKIKNKKILIFDDIYTTGSTVNECAKVLVQERIPKENIGILTIAKD